MDQQRVQHMIKKYTVVDIHNNVNNDVIKKQIKRADTASAWLEAVQIAGFSEEEANTLFGKPILSDLRNLTLSPHEPTHVKTQFLKLFNELMEQI